MPITYDLTTTTGKVRLLIKDKAGALFDDTDIAAFIDLEGGDEVFGIAKLAAASAKLAIAHDEALIQKVLKTPGLETDGASLGRELRLQAAALREEVATARALLPPDAEDQDGLFEIVDNSVEWCE